MLEEGGRLLGLVQEPKSILIHVRQGRGHEAAAVIVFEGRWGGLGCFLGECRWRSEDDDNAAAEAIRERVSLAGELRQSYATSSLLRFRLER